jgi:SAM-dependent methyltransferase
VSAIESSAEAEEWPPDGLERVDRCPVCGESARRLLYADLTDRSYRSAPGRWSLFRCGGCLSAYLDPRPDDTTAPLAYRTYYESAPSSATPEPSHGWRRVRRALRNGYLNERYGYRLTPELSIGHLLVPLFPRHRELADEHVRHLRLPPGRPRLLDVGCGEGAFLAEMQALGWTAEGIDPHITAAEHAAARGVPVRCGTLTPGLLEPGSFDAITFRLVFEHLHDPRGVLAECRRAIRPGGTLWIATPNIGSEGHRLFARNWFHLEPPRHAAVYSLTGLERLLAGSGFELVAVRPLRQAQWSFRLSAALARGLAPYDNAPPLSLALAFRARFADLKSLWSPTAADVIIAIARAT